MKIPNSKLCCQFKHSLYYIPDTYSYEYTDKETGEIKTRTGKYRRRAKSIDEVPYWRIYIVRITTLDKPDEYGYKTHRKIVHWSRFNYTIDKVFNLLRSWGDPSNDYTIDYGQRYIYEAWPRKTRRNKKV